MYLCLNLVVLKLSNKGMEGRTVLLAKLPGVEDVGVKAFLSPTLKHLLIWKDNHLALYNILKPSDFEHKGAIIIWDQVLENIESLCMSDDGKQFGVLFKSQQKKIELYKITEKDVFKEFEGIFDDKVSIARVRQDVCGSSENFIEQEVLVFVKDNAFVTCSQECLTRYTITQSETVLVYCTNLQHDIISYHGNKKYFYLLCETSIIYIYSLSDVSLVSIFDVGSVLPEDLQICRVFVSNSGSEMAVVTSKPQVYILDISSMLVKLASTSQLQPSAPSSSRSSVSSFNTTATSRSSNYSRVDSLRGEKPLKRVNSIVNASSATSSWLSYLEMLNSGRQIVTGENDKQSIRIVYFGDMPRNSTIHSVHFCQDTVSVWVSQHGSLADSSYRIYDKCTGQLESLDMLPAGTQVVGFDSACVGLDLFLQGTSLYLPLGVVSRDILIQKMIGGENENQVDEMIGHSVLPLPLLHEGLSCRQVDMVMLALNLHTQGFKSKMNEDGAVDELIASIQQLFDAITSAVKGKGDQNWRCHVQRLALTHANTLLALLTCPSALADLQTQIVQYVVELRRAEGASSVELPSIPQWNVWLPLSDEQVIMHSETSMTLVQCFLVLHRGWSDEELRGKRFYNAVQSVLKRLFLEGQFIEAIQLLIKLNLNPEEEVNAIFTQSKEPLIRNCIFENKGAELSEEMKQAWMFLSLIESVLISSKQCFQHSPLKICDVISLSAKDRGRVVVDLYLATADAKFKPHLNMREFWEFLLDHNYTFLAVSWLTGSGSQGDLDWPLSVLTQHPIELEFVNELSNCVQLTKHLICKELALMGIFTDMDKCQAQSLLLKLANAQSFPDRQSIFNKDSANIDHSQFLALLLSDAIAKHLVHLVVKFNLEASQHYCPIWMNLLQQHKAVEEKWNKTSVTQAIEETTLYLASLDSMESTVYLKQHPLVAVVTDTLREQNVCQVHSHVSHLLSAALLPTIASPDIDLYSVLAHTVPFHIDNIWPNSDKARTLIDFNNVNLSLQHGLCNLLGFENFLTQGRPASAVMFVMLKGQNPIRKKRVLASAHGLALCNFEDPVITSSCVLLIELLGQDASLLRTQLSTATVVHGYRGKQASSELMLNIMKESPGGVESLLEALEVCLQSVGDCNMSAKLAQWQLAVHYSVTHHLPVPRTLLTHSHWLLFVLAIQLFQYPQSQVLHILRCYIIICSEINEHLYYALHGTSVKAEERNVADLLPCLADVGDNSDSLLTLSHQLSCSVLALLAATASQVPVEVGLGSWLQASLCAEDTYHPGAPWTRDTFTQLLEISVKKCYFHTISQGFYIFQPVNPICALANFFIDCAMECKFKEATVNLKLFMAAISSIPDKSGQDTTFLMSKKWITNTSVRLVFTALAYSFQSCYLRRCFLKTLCESRFPSLNSDCQRLSLVLRLSECLAESTLQLDWERLCVHQDFSHLSQILQDLADQKMFETANKFAKIAGLPTDCVLVAQWSFLAQADKDLKFWEQCDDSFNKGSINPDVAVTFYRQQAKSTFELRERFILLKCALSWMMQTTSSKEAVDILQQEMFLTCLQDNFKIEVVTEGHVLAPLRCLSDSLERVTSQSRPPQLTSWQSHRLDDVIHQFLLFGNIKTAFILQSLFHHVNQDCELLLWCMRLAECVSSIAELPASLRQYLSADSLPRHPAGFTNRGPQTSDDTLQALYTLQAHRTSITCLFANIISGFKISLVLHCDYKSVIVNEEPLLLLGPQHSLEIATSLLDLACLPSLQCSEYVTSQILCVLQDGPVNGRYVLWSCDLDTDFTQILDHSGSALLMGNALLAANRSSQMSSYRIDAELLILAHHCFTKICHMEGIASVLTLARSLVDRLHDYCQWPLMVRLLTGIGRYTEMNYVFQILKSNDQFECLLGKGSDKPALLMTATLEFVRQNKDLFSLVVHHFSMYSELGSLYEEEARGQLAAMACTEFGDLVVSSHNHQCLQTAMSKYSDATEHYIHARKMKCGVASVQQAELIAVQLGLMTNCSGSEVPCLVNLTTSQALQTIHNLSSCEVAHVVARAYNLSGDWGAALYNNCVVRGDPSYLASWSRYHQLTTTIVLDVAHRFQCESETNVSLEVNMKQFVSSVPLLDIKYRIASQMGFKDILQQLLHSPDMAFLKDTVWQSGFKQQHL